jgi:hypothetical protein
LSSLKIRISGVKVSDYPLLNEGRQALKGDILEISKETEENMKEKKYLSNIRKGVLSSI